MQVFTLHRVNGGVQIDTTNGQMNISSPTSGLTVKTDEADAIQFKVAAAGGICYLLEERPNMDQRDLKMNRLCQGTEMSRDRKVAQRQRNILHGYAKSSIRMTKK